jgi:opacity protein-like surface antigen
MKILKSISLVLTVIIVASSFAYAQQVPNPRLSPVMISSTTIDNTYIKVVYGMPFKNDREIFGGLVPFNQVWRTGANEATEITLTGDVMFAGEHLPSGHYSLFTIPGENEWTVIINSGLGQWGSNRYNEELDVMRVTVPVETLDEVWEAFRIQFTEVDDTIHMTLRWDTTGIRVPIGRP